MNRFKLLPFLFWILLCLPFFGFSGSSVQKPVLTGARADEVVPGAVLVRVNPVSEVPDFVQFAPGHEVPYVDYESWIKRQFNLPDAMNLQEKSSFRDELGYRHVTLQPYYKGILLDGMMYKLHIRNGLIVSMNGLIQAPFNQPSMTSLSADQARNIALNHVGAVRYKWEMPEEEELLKRETGNPNATYFPAGELVYFPYKGRYDAADYRLCYRFNIYADEPLYRAWVYVDALTGEIVFENEIIHTVDVNGTAVTAYSGTQTIVTDSFSGGYRLREAGRGNGVETYNLQNGTNYGAAVDFLDSDNYWNNQNANLDEYATDAHWGAEMTYDYYLTKHNRNSIDNNGFALKSYVHYSNNYVNAFWDGQRMTYGDGNGSNVTPLTSLDIAGHEITHGLTSFTANLTYSYESGALNESFSDIFGTAIEHYGKPASANWTMGEDIGITFRSMSNPNAYNDPDTYHGTYWYTGSGDNGGVHTNSGVQNYWFYLMSVGDTGTNDNGNYYNITGMGIDTASKIAFRNLTVYLVPSSQYSDARFYAIQSAIDLYGACTQPVITTTDAWYAVGVGDTFVPTVTSDFTAGITSHCEVPFTVQFTNLSTNAGTFLWDFGDGTTSTAVNPSHTYTASGNYTVTLIADGNACGKDTATKVNFIRVGPGNPCTYTMPDSGSQTLTHCVGLLYDSGGPNGNYPDNSDVTTTISPAGATSVTLTFSSFNFETNWDYLYVYDGPGTASPLIGSYTGTSLPNGGTITSSGGSITLRQYSDVAVTYSGFALNWSCFIPNSPPLVQFDADVTSTCSGIVHFTDNSLFSPTSWLWDFGDGDTSTQQNPTHVYDTNGYYTVKLVAANQYGSDSLTRIQYIYVNKPAGPAVNNGWRCGPGSVTLSTQWPGSFEWYDQPLGGTLLDTGSVFTTPAISTTTTYYVQESVPNPVQYVGPPDNNFGSGGYYTGNRHLIFDVYNPCTLVSVKVYASGAGNRTIELRDHNGTVLQSLTANIPDGMSRVTLNWHLNPGTDYQLGVAGTGSNLYRNSSGASFPYTLPGLISIKGTNAPAGYYYFYYDWEVQQDDCVTLRSPAVAKVIDPPTVTASGDTSICQGAGPVILTAAPVNNDTLFWNPGGDTTFSISVNPSVTTVYTVTAGNLCGTATDTAVVTVLPLPLVSASADTNICAGNTITLSATGNGSFLWSPGGQTSPSITVNPAVPTTYRVSVTNSCGTVTDSVHIGMLPQPSASISGAQSICLGDSVLLTVSGTGTFTWMPGNFTGSSVWVKPQSATTYTVTATTLCGSDTDTQTVAVIPQPSVTAPADTAICPGGQAVLAAAGTGSFTWMPGNLAGSTITVSPSATTTYTVTATNSCGQATDTVTVDVLSLPSVSAPAHQNICPGGQVTVTAIGVGIFSWMPGNYTGNTVTLSPQATTVYTITSTTQCGTVSDTFSVTVLPQPSVTAWPDTTICAGNPVTLYASGTGSFGWNPGNLSGSSITVSPLTTTEYTVTATNACGSTKDSVRVIVLPQPSVQASADTAICPGHQAHLSATGTGSFTWNPGNQPGSDIWVSPAAGTMYTVTASNQCGSVADSVFVQVDPLPAGGFIWTANNLTVAFTDTSTNATSWSWDFGDGDSSSLKSPSHTYSQPGSYIVTLVVSNNCGQDTVTLEVQVTNTGLPVQPVPALKADIYPNPAHDRFSLYIHSNSSGPVFIRVYNVLGQQQEARKDKLSSGLNVYAFDLSGKAAGIYMVEIITRSGKLLQKVMVE